MIKLSKEQVIMLHSQLIAETGGTDGIRDETLLESALNAPFQTFGDTQAFPSIHQKAARLGYGLIQNHAFVDGNKRIGTHAMLVFLALNKIELEYEQNELVDFILQIADGSLPFNDLLRWVIEHQV